MDDSRIGNLVISLVVGLVFFLSGLLLKKKPPAFANAFYGYRTPRSMKNQLLWDAGNRYSAEIMIRFGILFLIIGIILSLMFNGEVITFVILGLMILLILIMFIKVERRLRFLENAASKGEEK